MPTNLISAWKSFSCVLGCITYAFIIHIRTVTYTSYYCKLSLLENFKIVFFNCFFNCSEGKSFLNEISFTPWRGKTSQNGFKIKNGLHKKFPQYFIKILLENSNLLWIFSEVTVCTLLRANVSKTEMSKTEP